MKAKSSLLNIKKDCFLLQWIARPDAALAVEGIAQIFKKIFPEN